MKTWDANFFRDYVLSFQVAMKVLVIVLALLIAVNAAPGGRRAR